MVKTFQKYPCCAAEITEPTAILITVYEEKKAFSLFSKGVFVFVFHCRLATTRRQKSAAAEALAVPQHPTNKSLTPVCTSSLFAVAQTIPG